MSVEANNEQKHTHKCSQMSVEANNKWTKLKVV